MSGGSYNPWEASAAAQQALEQGGIFFFSFGLPSFLIILAFSSCFGAFSFSNVMMLTCVY